MEVPRGHPSSLRPPAPRRGSPPVGGGEAGLAAPEACGERRELPRAAGTGERRGDPGPERRERAGRVARRSSPFPGAEAGTGWWLSSVGTDREPRCGGRPAGCLPSAPRPSPAQGPCAVGALGSSPRPGGPGSRFPGGRVPAGSPAAVICTIGSRRDPRSRLFFFLPTRLPPSWAVKIQIPVRAPS